MDYCDAFENYVDQLLYRMSFDLGWFDGSLMIRFRLYIFGRNYEVALCSSHQMLSGGARFQCVPLLVISLIIGLKWCLHCKITLDTYSLFILKIMYTVYVYMLW